MAKGISMETFTSCKEAIMSCLKQQAFSIAHLYHDDKTMNIHVHDCYEIYFSISGGKQFLIDNCFYDFNPGDIFFINQYESHYLSQIDDLKHERIIISVYPDYLKAFCTEHTDLNYCFSNREEGFGHKLSLTPDEQKRFMYFIHIITQSKGFGSDILDKASFMELMTFLNGIYLQYYNNEERKTTESITAHHKQIDEILSYINQNIAEDLSILSLSNHFYLSTSYLCKIFKSQTGTTINKYITAKRITYAKSLLSSGYSVTDTCNLCGYKDYSNFLKAFTKLVGISPKKYTQFTT